MTIRRIHIGKQLAVEIVLLVAMGLILGLLGPFGTYLMPLGSRLLYWVSFGMVGYCFFRPITFIANWLSEASPVPLWLSTAIATGVAAFPVTLLIGTAIYGPDAIGSPQFNIGFAPLYLQVAGIGVGIFLLMQLLFGRGRAADTRIAAMTPTAGKTGPATANDGPDCPPLTRLHERLPAGFPARIIALGVEDHYVRVHAVIDGKGRTEMLLMRLGDAMAETDPVAGEQVHRGWWASRSSVTAVRRDGRNIRLELEGGLEVPVSRTHAARLKSAGWF